MRPMYRFKEARGSDFEHSSNIQLRLITLSLSFFIPMFSAKLI